MFIYLLHRITTKMSCEQCKTILQIAENAFIIPKSFRKLLYANFIILIICAYTKNRGALHCHSCVKIKIKIKTIEAVKCLSEQ